MIDAVRRQAEARGRWAERITAWHYRLRGFRVLAMRYRTPAGEIDLVMRRGDLLVFTEVKARARLDDALHALRPQQCQRLVRAATLFLRDHPVHSCCTMQFDLAAIRPWRLPQIIADAWRLE